MQNFSFISEYITQHGRIKRADQTGLRPVNQRKVAKAIRRAIGLGIHPSVHRHPELLMREARTTGQQNMPTGQMSNYYRV
jgi:small subunit ribosomal protein S18